MLKVSRLTPRINRIAANCDRAIDSESIARIGIIYDGRWGLPFEG
jgi:hypothetical protein